MGRICKLNLTLRRRWIDSKWMKFWSLRQCSIDLTTPYWRVKTELTLLTPACFRVSSPQGEVHCAPLYTSGLVWVGGPIFCESPCQISTIFKRIHYFWMPKTSLTGFCFFSIFFASSEEFSLDHIKGGISDPTFFSRRNMIYWRGKSVLPYPNWLLGRVNFFETLARTHTEKRSKVWNWGRWK